MWHREDDNINGVSLMWCKEDDNVDGVSLKYNKLKLKSWSAYYKLIYQYIFK